MKIVLLFIFSLVPLICECGERKLAKQDAGILMFNDYGFAAKNPYTSEDLAAANDYLEQEIEKNKAGFGLSMLIVPRSTTNRLYFISSAPDCYFSVQDAKRYGDLVLNFLLERKKSKSPSSKEVIPHEKRESSSQPNHR